MPFHGIDFSVHDDQFYSLRGPSVYGTRTTLRCLSGFGSAARNLGIEVDDSIEIAEKIDACRLHAVPPTPDMVGGVQDVAAKMAFKVSYWEWLCENATDD